MTPEGEWRASGERGEPRTHVNTWEQCEHMGTLSGGEGSKCLGKCLGKGETMRAKGVSAGGDKVWSCGGKMTAGEVGGSVNRVFLGLVIRGD